MKRSDKVEQEEWEEERRDEVFAAWIRSGSVKGENNDNRWI